MKKVLLGMLIGCGISFAVSVHAEVIDTVVGKVIQGVFPVKVEGKELVDKAIVIDGTSYLPVLAFGEATGYDVKFDAVTGISLDKKVTPAPTTSTTKYDPPKEERLKDIERSLQSLKVGIPFLQNAIETRRKIDPQDKQAFDMEKALIRDQNKIAELEKQKEDLQTQSP